MKCRRARHEVRGWEGAAEKRMWSVRRDYKAGLWIFWKGEDYHRTALEGGRCSVDV